ncbi:MAG: BatA domain-containing protein, partial [Thermomicrobiales bacterium]
MSDFRFLLPAGLIALISLPLVVLFHMRSPTPRAVPVPALRFWRVAAPRPTDEPRFRRPPLTLSMILHLLTALALSLA